MGISREAQTASLYGAGDIDRLFPDGALGTTVPWEQAGRFKRQPLYHPGSVGDALAAVRAGEQMPEFVDPRNLLAIQGGLQRAGVQYYLGDEYANSGQTFADRDKVTNQIPIVYTRLNGQQMLLTGHRRAAAALLQGRPLAAIKVQEPEDAYALRDT